MVPDALADVIDDGAEAVERHGGLAVEGDGTAEVDALKEVVEVLDDDGVAFGLADESEHFGVSVFAENDDLRLGIAVVLVFDAPLWRSPTPAAA